MKITKLIIVFVMLFIFFGYAYACGPDFDSAYLVRASKEEFLAIPEGDFLFELSRIAGKKIGFDKTRPPELDQGKESTASADVKDLEEALKASNLTEKEKEKIIASYNNIRLQILNYLKSDTIENSSIWYGGRFRNFPRGKPQAKSELSIRLNFPKTVPREFVLYTEGAVAYHNNHFDEAILKWKELLALPKQERHFKSVWAAFMIGKSYLSIRKEKESIRYLEMTRELLSEGFKDSLGLAQDSFGWQALAEYELKDFTSSLKHYLNAEDVNSLNHICSAIFELDSSVLESVIKDDKARKIIIGWVVSRPTFYGKLFWLAPDDDPSKDIYAKVLKAIEKVQPKGTIDNADRIAWIYYAKGDIESSKKWLKLSKEESALAKFIAVKLMLREGKVDEAIESLHNLVPIFEKGPERDIFFENDIVRELNTDIGVLKLSRKDYLMAFNILLKGKYWEDVAYVAEKVLTSDELENYLKQHAQDKEMSFPRQWYDGYYAEMKFYFEKHPDLEWQKDWEERLDKDTMYQALSYLLGRRFAREKRWDKAIEYLPTSVEIWRNESRPSGEGYLIWEQKKENINPKMMLNNFVNLLKKAQDVNLSKQERAKSYYDAALILRKYGMEIMGTELDPDGFVFSGGFMCYDSLETRFSILSKEVEEYYKGWYKEHIERLKNRRKEIEKKRDFFTGSEDEEERVLASLPEPLRRFHYRYKAANLMWKAAELLPDNDELKAKALCIGGSYLKIRDPQLADKFYKALVKTCGKTKLGQEADKLKWFPKIKEIE